MGNKIQGPPPPPYSRRGGSPIEQSGRTLDNGFSEGGGSSQGASPSDISPIACAFGLEILLGSIVDLSDLAASYSRSAADAAWRGDVNTLGVHLRQARNALEAALMAFNAVEGETAASAERASA
jgi:hypothetical protein